MFIDSFGSKEALGLALLVDLDDTGRFVSLTSPQLSDGCILPNAGLEALFRLVFSS